MNIYKPINDPINSNESKVINDYAKVAGVEIDASRRTTVSNRRFFTFDDLTSTLIVVPEICSDIIPIVLIFSIIYKNYGKK
jgi:hypothetical protein